MNDLNAMSIIKSCIKQTTAFDHLEQVDLRETIQWNNQLTTTQIPLIIPHIHLNTSQTHASCIHELPLEQLSATSFTQNAVYAIHVQDDHHDSDQLKTVLDSCDADKRPHILLFLREKSKNQKNILLAIERWKSSFPDIPIAIGPLCSVDKIPALAAAGASIIRFGYGLSQFILTEQYGVSGSIIEQFTACKQYAQEHAMVLLADCIIHEYSDIPKLFALGAHAVRVDDQSIAHFIRVMRENSLPSGGEREELVAEDIYFRTSPYHTCIDQIFHILQVVLSVTDASRISELATHTTLL